MRSTEYLSELRLDARFALRQLVRAPGFTLVAVLTLAIGIGATTAIFSAVEAVVLRPFAFVDPARTVFLAEWWHNLPGSVSAGNYEDWKAQSTSFVQVATSNPTSFNLAEGDTPERLTGALVSWNYFAVFGVQPLLGRVFRPEEDQPGADQEAVLSHDLWQRRFAGDPSIVGRTIRVNQKPYTVVGVMPLGVDPELSAPLLWAPIAFTAARRAMRDEHYLTVVARLKPGVTLAQAQRELDAIALVEQRRFPQEDADRSIRALSLPDSLIGNYRQRLFIMLGAVGCVLLIACGNVANLLLARGAARGREIAIRAAIGAGRWRIVRQLLTESVVLAIAAAGVGLLIAWAGVQALKATGPANVPRLAETRIDAGVVAFAAGVAVLTALVCGLVPALRAARPRLQGALQESGRTAVAFTRDRVRTALVAMEVAMALTLLVGTGLLIRSALYLDRLAPGFETAGVLSARLALPPEAYGHGDGGSLRTFEQVVERLERSPGIASAAISSQAPMGPGGSDNGLIPEGRPLEEKSAVDAQMHLVSPAYFATLRIPVVRGHTFTADDRAGAPRVMVVSQTLARTLWPGADPVGKRVACCEGAPGDPRWKTVIGVVGDVRSAGPMKDITPEFYLPVEQAPPQAWDWVQRTMTIVVRGGSSDANAANDQTAPLAAALRRAVHDVDPGLPLFGVQTMEALRRTTLAPARFNTLLLGVLGLTGLVLCALGIYSVIAYFVSLRVHEIGIRMALGATSGDILRLTAWQGLRPVFLGLVVGALAALWAVRGLSASIYGVSTADPLTFAAVTLVLLVVSVAAMLVPARRATRVEPTRALAGM